MSDRNTGLWALSKAISRSILLDRAHRRRLLLRMLVVMMAIFAIGLWGIDGWLEADIVRFALWWLACGGLAVLIFVLAVFDALAVVREERARFLRGEGDND